MYLACVPTFFYMHQNGGNMLKYVQRTRPFVCVHCSNKFTHGCLSHTALPIQVWLWTWNRKSEKAFLYSFWCSKLITRFCDCVFSVLPGHFFVTCISPSQALWNRKAFLCSCGLVRLSQGSVTTDGVCARSDVCVSTTIVPVIYSPAIMASWCYTLSYASWLSRRLKCLGNRQLVHVHVEVTLSIYYLPSF